MLIYTRSYDSVANQQVLTPFELVLIVVYKTGHICFYSDAFHKATVSLKFSSRTKSRWVSSSGHKACRRWGQALGYQWPWCQGEGTRGKRPRELCWLSCPSPTWSYSHSCAQSDYFLLGPKLGDFHKGPNSVVKLCTFPTGLLEFQLPKEGEWHADE